MRYLMPLPSSPIGVFDSGVGGLSVLRALRAALPHEHFVYLADSANAPYGERGDAYVSARTHAITQYLREQHGIKALVVACNTATAAAIHEVRSSHPDLPLVGLEPAIKPALAVTHTGRVGVIGTRGTLTSSKFGKLLSSLEGQAHFVVQPCDGLAHAIERSVNLPKPTEGSAINATETGALCEQYIQAMGAFGSAAGQIDTLVLGCTHYIFVADELRALVGPAVQFIETGEPVARQARRLLESAGLLRTENRVVASGNAGSEGRDGGDDSDGGGAGDGGDCAGSAGNAGNAGSAGSAGEEVSAAAAAAHDPAPGDEPLIQLLTTGPLGMLQAAAQRWLGLPANCCATVSVP